MKPVWRFELFDNEGKWGIKENYNHRVFQEVLSKVKNFETMKWSEIQSKKKNNHDVSVSKLCREATSRLKTLKLNDIDSLFSLRLSGTQRVYGILEKNSFKIIWLDTKHEVYPVEKKHA